MLPRSGWSSFLLAVCLISSISLDLRADAIRLKNGGEIRGQIQKTRSSSSSQKLIVIKTLNGSEISVDRDEVEAILRRRLAVEHYEIRRREVPDTVEDHWELAQWCREQHLSSQRHDHLKRIIELEPQHEGARRGLGHQLYDGEWMSRAEFMQSQGRVFHRGKWVFPQELDQIESDLQEQEEQREWHRKVKMWYTWLTGDRTDRREQAIQEMQAIDDPQAVPALVKRFSDNPNIRFREFYVKLLGGIGGRDALNALITQALLDVKLSIRETAVDVIPESDQDAAVSAFLKGLKSKSNDVVNRSATALAKLGNDQVVPHLIEALVTSHKYRIVVPEDGSRTIGFSTNGGFPAQQQIVPPEIEAQMLTGQLPYGAVVVPQQMPGAELRTTTKLIRKTETNPAVLNALRELTGEDFSYNRDKWRLWWAEKNNTVSKS